MFQGGQADRRKYASPSNVERYEVLLACASRLPVPSDPRSMQLASERLWEQGEDLPFDIGGGNVRDGDEDEQLATGAGRSICGYKGCPQLVPLTTA